MRSSVLALVLAVGLLVAACSSTTSSPRTLDPTPSWATPSGSPYTTGRKTDISYGSNKAQKMDLCYPPSRPTNTSAFLLIHGGGWSSGSKADFGGLCATIARLGYVAATMDYRMFDQGATYADMLADIDLALATYRDTARTDGWPITEVALMGASAGAHLSLMYAYTRTPILPIGFVVGMSSPTDFLDPVFLENATPDQFSQLSQLLGVKVTRDTVDQRSAALQAASPAFRVTRGSPPTILAHGAKDSVVPYSNAILLTSRLASLGVPYDLLTYPTSDHNLADDPDVNTRFLQLVLDYAARYLS
jgi:acetyl esterase/lipase